MLSFFYLEHPRPPEIHCHFLTFYAFWFLGPPKVTSGTPSAKLCLPGSNSNYATSIPLNVKNDKRCAKKCFFIIFATVISGMPTPEICFLSGQLRRTILPKERYDDSLSDGESATQPSSWEADTTTELSSAQRNLRHHCLGVRWCYD